ncbi:nuclear transport factor 2 family protein [Aquisediminimonas profunda]|uniref:nuclear transport factor 2 family protein n=1 Tax=Aquisediminimonas profunda TaxID=1550733 RepID=UPI001C634517|nr:nuclear transport factor 2 family protein [Aquisediminimonas profunda]
MNKRVEGVTEAPSLKEKVQLAYSAFSRGDMDGFMAHLCFHPDAVMIEPDGLPYGGNYRGPDAIRKGIENAVATWEDFGGFVEDVAASGNLVYVHMHVMGKGKASGEAFAMPIVEVLRFRDGQLIEFRPFYFDTARCRSCFER